MDKIDHVFIAPRDFDKSFAFYCETLGFEPTSRWGGKGSPRGALLKHGAVTVVIAEKHDDAGDQAWRSGMNGTRPTLHIKTDDLKERFASLKGREEVVVEPEKTHWGVEWFVVADPDGNILAFEGPLKK